MNELNRLVVVILLLSGFQVGASTFIGNGGSEGDVELSVTKSQYKEAIKSISEDEEREELCTCESVFENHSICEALNNLNEAQRKFCTKTLYDKSKELYYFVNSSQSAQINWTHENISVNEAGTIRAADAVTNTSSNTITFNFSRFMEMSPSARLLLYSHEMSHLLKIDGKQLTDKGAIGPFKNEDGSRDLVNAMAAAIVSRAEENKLFNKYKRNLVRSKGYKKNWIDGQISFSKNSYEDPKVYQIDSHTLIKIKGRLYWENLGIVVSAASGTGLKQILTNTEVQEEIITYGVGVSYRFFPYSDPLTSLGQSHFVVNLMYENLNSKLSADDKIIKIESEDSSAGTAFEVQYLYPLQNDFWLNCSLNVQSHQYNHPEFNTFNDVKSRSINLGVSYGF